MDAQTYNDNIYHASTAQHGKNEHSTSEQLNTGRYPIGDPVSYSIYVSEMTLSISTP